MNESMLRAQELDHLRYQEFNIQAAELLRERTNEGIKDLGQLAILTVTSGLLEPVHNPEYELKPANTASEQDLGAVAIQEIVRLESHFSQDEIEYAANREYTSPLTNPDHLALAA